MLFQNKFKLSKEDNIFLAKRNIVDNIYKSARLEGIAITFPQTEAIFNGANVAGLSVDDIVAINNLKHAWKFIFETMEYPLADFGFICELNRKVGSNLFPNPGYIRSIPVGIGGTTWTPDIPFKADVEDNIKTINQIENTTEKALEMMLFVMRSQIFLDGNKRTATLVANRILIDGGAGLLNINVADIHDFKTLLIEFYETNEKDKLKAFLFDRCINGFEIPAPTLEEKQEQKENRKKIMEYSIGR